MFTCWVAWLNAWEDLPPEKVGDGYVGECPNVTVYLDDRSWWVDSVVVDVGDDTVDEHVGASVGLN